MTCYIPPETIFFILDPSHAPFSTITPKGGGNGTKITAIFTASLGRNNSYTP